MKNQEGQKTGRVTPSSTACLGIDVNPCDARRFASPLRCGADAPSYGKLGFMRSFKRQTQRSYEGTAGKPGNLTMVSIVVARFTVFAAAPGVMPSALLETQASGIAMDQYACSIHCLSRKNLFPFCIFWSSLTFHPRPESG